MILLNPSEATAKKAKELGLNVTIGRYAYDHPLLGFDGDDIISITTGGITTSVERFNSDTRLKTWTGYDRSEYQAVGGKVECDPTWLKRALEANFIQDVLVDGDPSHPTTVWKAKLRQYGLSYPEHNWINQIALAVLCLYTDEDLTGDQLLKALLARHLKVGTWKVTRLYDTKGLIFSNGDESSDCSLESFVRAMLSLNQA